MKKICLLLALCISLSLFVSCSGGGNVSTASSDTESNAVSDAVSDVSEEESAPEAKKVLDGSKLVVFGDSITALGSWGRTVAEECNMEYFNGARGGITSAEGLQRFNAFVKAREPDFVTLCFGMNDLLMTDVDTPKCTPEAFKRNMKKMVEKVREIGAIPLIVTTNPLNVDVFFASQGQSPDLYGGRDILEWLDTYNNAARELADEMGCDLIDVRAACDEYEIKQVVKTDGIHLSELGNVVFAQTISKYLKENFKTDPYAPLVDRDNTINVLTSAEILPFDKEQWYFDTPGSMVITGGSSLKLMNTNGLWPDAQCVFDKWYGVHDRKTDLKIRMTTANVNASIVLYFNGATPNAYTDDQYLVINPFLGCECDSYTGDILANQTIDVTIPFDSLPFPESLRNGSNFCISGAKIYVAGNANQAVEIFEFRVISK